MKPPLGISSLCSLIALAVIGAARADLASNAAVPAAEKASLSEVYRLEIPDSSPDWNSAAIPYSVNNVAGTASGYVRVAYYLELGSTTNPLLNQFVYASFDVIPDLDTPIELGVPSIGPNGSGKVIKASVLNLRVFSTALGATSGVYPTGGNLEFWPSNYGTGANGIFDYDDDGFSSAPGAASMQIHNGGLQQTLISYSGWGFGSDCWLGVGTQPSGSGHPDWTFATSNNDQFNVQTLQIFVQPIPEPGSSGLAILGGVGLLLRRRRAWIVKP